MIADILTDFAAALSKNIGLPVRTTERVDDSGLMRLMGGDEQTGLDTTIAPAFDLITPGQARAAFDTQSSCGYGRADLRIPVQLLYFGHHAETDVVANVLAAMPALAQSRYTARVEKDIVMDWNYASVWGQLYKNRNGSRVWPEKPVYVEGFHAALFTFDLTAKSPLNTCNPLCPPSNRPRT